MPRSVPSLFPCEPRQRIASCSFMLVSCRPCAHMTRGDRSDGPVGPRRRRQRQRAKGKPPAPAPVSRRELRSDEIWMGRWLLYRIAEDFEEEVTLAAKPVSGDWNGAGAHTNFSTNATRESYAAIIMACEALAKDPIKHVKNYGVGIEDRLTGAHETAHWSKFSYGSSDRGASVRIPWAVEKGQ